MKFLNITDTYLNRSRIGERPMTHAAVYHMEPGWLFLELGGYTLEVTYRPLTVRDAVGAALRSVVPLGGLACVAFDAPAAVLAEALEGGAGGMWDLLGLQEGEGEGQLGAQPSAQQCRPVA